MKTKQSIWYRTKKKGIVQLEVTAETGKRQDNNKKKNQRKNNKRQNKNGNFQPCAQLSAQKDIEAKENGEGLYGEFSITNVIKATRICPNITKNRE